MSSDEWFRKRKSHLLGIISDAIKKRGEDPWVERTNNGSLLIGITCEQGVAFFFTCKITAHSRSLMDTIEREP